MTSSMLPSLFGKPQKPFFKNLQQEIDRVFDDFRDNSLWDRSEALGGTNGMLNVKLDVVETDSEIEISTELPGVKAEDIDVSASDNILTIKGEKSAEEKKDEENYHLVERSYGSFHRSIPFNFNIEAKSVNADFSDGVLKIKIEKPEEIAAKTQKIEISKST